MRRCVLVVWWGKGEDVIGLIPPPCDFWGDWSQFGPAAIPMSPSISDQWLCAELAIQTRKCEGEMRF